MNRNVAFLVQRYPILPFFMAVKRMKMNINTVVIKEIFKPPFQISSVE